MVKRNIHLGSALVKMEINHLCVPLDATKALGGMQAGAVWSLWKVTTAGRQAGEEGWAPELEVIPPTPAWVQGGPKAGRQHWGTEERVKKALYFRLREQEGAQRREKYAFFPLLSCVPAPRSFHSGGRGHGDSRGLRVPKTPRERDLLLQSADQSLKVVRKCPLSSSSQSSCGPSSRSHSCRKYASGTATKSQVFVRRLNRGVPRNWKYWGDGGEGEAWERDCTKLSVSSRVHPKLLTCGSHPRLWELKCGIRSLLMSQTGHCMAQIWKALQRLENWTDVGTTTHRKLLGTYSLIHWIAC